MTKTEAKKRIAKLREEINYQNYFYHVLDNPKISEGALDSLKNELFKLEQQFPDLITPDSPTQRIAGKALSKFAKVTHATRMISLYDAFSEQDMNDWQERNYKIISQRPAYYCELKLDGLAVSLIYKNGVLVRGATRGDGLTGEDVTNNLRTINSIPLSLRHPTISELKKLGLTDFDYRKEIEIRGEAIMTETVLKKLNQQYGKQGKALLANARNAAAGSIRQLDPKITAERNLDFYCYDIATDVALTWHDQEHELAKLLGFKSLAANKRCQNLQEVFNFHHHWEKNRDKFDFECDGVVVVVNNTTLWPRLGVVGKGPRYMMAYKFTNEQATTKLLDVIWQVGRTGILTPTAKLAPVRVKGVTISNATLHNFDEIQRLHLKIGDTVIVERAGDVIPKIVGMLPKLRDGKEKNIAPPKVCPICGSKVAKTGDEVAFRCLNKNCYAVNLRRLMHWTAKDGLDIEGLGPKIIEQLVKAQLVSDPADFYELTKEDVLSLERFAEVSAHNVIKAIDKSRQPRLDRFVYALGIEHVGEETAILLADSLAGWAKAKKIAPRSPVDILTIMDEVTEDQLRQLPDIGDKVAQSIKHWFDNLSHRNFLKHLSKVGLSLVIPVVRKSALAGKSFVVTGTLSGLTRQQAKDTIRRQGGAVSESVSRETDYIVVGENPGSKYDKARQLGVTILSEKDFLKLIS